MQPSKEDCIVPGEAVRVAAPQIALRRDFRKVRVTVFILKVQGSFAPAQDAGIVLDQLRDEQHSLLQVSQNPTQVQLIPLNFLLHNQYLFSLSVVFFL